MMAQCEEAPPRGTYIEIRLGDHVMVGKVMWSKGREFGVMLSDPIDVQGLIEGKPPSPQRPETERRRKTRQLVLTTASDWRWIGQTFERACLACGVTLMVACAAIMAYEALSAPLEAVAATLH